jgi:proteasome component ECM29
MDIISELQAELSSLNRVSHRLATTPNDGSAFQKVVALLLPRLLQRIGKNDESSKRNKNIFYNNSSMRRDSGGSNKRKEPSSPATTSAVANSGGADFAVATTDEQLQQQQQLPQQQQQQQQQIDNLHTTIHTKYIEMITHIRKRVRDDRNCLLPCDAILDLLLPAPASSTTTTTNCNNISEGEASTIVTTPTDGSSSRSSSSFGGGGGGNPFTINLSLAFLTLGINRCSPLECAQLLPRMLLFLESIYTEYDDDKISKTNKSGTISVRYMLDPNRSMRHDQMCHLILRCLESTARSNPVENAASTPRAMKQSLSSVSTTSLSRNDNTASSTESAAVKSSNSKNIHSLLHNTKQILTTNPTIASALFDLIVDVILYTPIPSTSSLIPFGLSMMGYQRLIGGAASEASSASWGCKNWREEYNTAANAVSGSNSGRGGGGGGAGSNLKQLKLKLLDMIAPCRKYALFLPEKKTMTSKTEEASTSVVVAVTEVATAARGNDEEAVSSESGSVDAIDSQQYDGMGISRTVALMVLFMGESDPDVKNRAESYLRAHMDSYRGREVPRSATMRRSATDGGAATSSIGGNDDDFPAETTIHDALLGNSVALTQSILMLCLGGAASLNIEKSLSSQYNNANSIGILKSRLGLTYYADVTIAQEQKKILSCSRMKMSEQSATSALKFAAKMLDENPRLFHVGMDMESEESDVAAVSTGTLVLAVMSDMHRPGSSASSALESAASLLNSLCVRLSLLYDARVQSRVAVPESLERIRLLLARAMKLVCSILSPTSSGESTSSSSLGTKASTTQIEIRDKCYGVICTLARSLFALNDRYALFDCGNSNPQPAKSAASFPLDMISTAKLLFGCSSNEVDMLQPRATSALDALLGAKIRAVKFIAEQKKTTIVDMNGSDAATNPWANISGHGDNKLESNVVDPSSDGLSRSLLPLLWSSARSNLPKSSRLAAARWSSELLLKLDCTNAFHILCFMSGDNDATVAAIAKQALGVDKSLGEDNAIRSGSNLSESDISDRDGNTRPAFSALLETIFGSQSSTSTRPLYSSFNVHAKAATLRFLLQSLFSEENIYDNDDDLAIQKYVSTIVGTMANYADRSLSRDEIDLIDECSIALASCSATSKEARLTVTKRGELVSELHYSYNNIAKQALTSNSSKTRVRNGFERNNCICAA